MAPAWSKVSPATIRTLTLEETAHGAGGTARETGAGSNTAEEKCKPALETSKLPAVGPLEPATARSFNPVTHEVLLQKAALPSLHRVVLQRERPLPGKQALVTTP